MVSDASQKRLETRRLTYLKINEKPLESAAEKMII
jgi:hypothetical protein